MEPNRSPSPLTPLVWFPIPNHNNQIGLRTNARPYVPQFNELIITNSEDIDHLIVKLIEEKYFTKEGKWNGKPLALPCINGKTENLLSHFFKTTELETYLRDINRILSLHHLNLNQWDISGSGLITFLGYGGFFDEALASLKNSLSFSFTLEYWGSNNIWSINCLAEGPEIDVELLKEALNNSSELPFKKTPYGLSAQIQKTNLSPVHLNIFINQLLPEPETLAIRHVKGSQDRRVIGTWDSLLHSAFGILAPPKQIPYFSLINRWTQGIRLLDPILENIYTTVFKIDTLSKGKDAARLFQSFIDQNDLKREDETFVLSLQALLTARFKDGECQEFFKSLSPEYFKLKNSLLKEIYRQIDYVPFSTLSLLLKLAATCQCPAENYRSNSTLYKGEYGIRLTFDSCQRSLIFDDSPLDLLTKVKQCSINLSVINLYAMLFEFKEYRIRALKNSPSIEKEAESLLNDPNPLIVHLGLTILRIFSEKQLTRKQLHLGLTSSIKLPLPLSLHHHFVKGILPFQSLSSTHLDQFVKDLSEKKSFAISLCNYLLNENDYLMAYPIIQEELSSKEPEAEKFIAKIVPWLIEKSLIGPALKILKIKPDLMPDALLGVVMSIRSGERQAYLKDLARLLSTRLKPEFNSPTFSKNLQSLIEELLMENDLIPAAADLLMEGIQKGILKKGIENLSFNICKTVFKTEFGLRFTAIVWKTCFQNSAWPKTEEGAQFILDLLDELLIHDELRDASDALVACRTYKLSETQKTQFLKAQELYLQKVLEGKVSIPLNIILPEIEDNPKSHDLFLFIEKLRKQGGPDDLEMLTSILSNPRLATKLWEDVRKYANYAVFCLGHTPNNEVLALLLSTPGLPLEEGALAQKLEPFINVDELNQTIVGPLKLTHARLIKRWVDLKMESSALKLITKLLPFFKFSDWDDEAGKFLLTQDIPSASFIQLFEHFAEKFSNAPILAKIYCTKGIESCERKDRGEGKRYVESYLRVRKHTREMYAEVVSLAEGALILKQGRGFTREILKGLKPVDAPSVEHKKLIERVLEDDFKEKKYNDCVAFLTSNLTILDRQSQQVWVERLIPAIVETDIKGAIKLLRACSTPWNSLWSRVLKSLSISENTSLFKEATEAWAERDSIEPLNAEALECLGYLLPMFDETTLLKSIEIVLSQPNTPDLHRDALKACFKLPRNKHKEILELIHKLQQHSSRDINSDLSCIRLFLESEKKELIESALVLFKAALINPKDLKRLSSFVNLVIKGANQDPLLEKSCLETVERAVKVLNKEINFTDCFQLLAAKPGRLSLGITLLQNLLEAKETKREGSLESSIKQFLLEANTAEEFKALEGCLSHPHLNKLIDDKSKRVLIGIFLQRAFKLNITEASNWFFKLYSYLTIGEPLFLECWSPVITQHTTRYLEDSDSRAFEKRHEALIDILLPAKSPKQQWKKSAKIYFELIKHYLLLIKDNKTNPAQQRTLYQNIGPFLGYLPSFTVPDLRSTIHELCPLYFQISFNQPSTEKAHIEKAFTCLETLHTYSAHLNADFFLDETIKLLKRLPSHKFETGFITKVLRITATFFMNFSPNSHQISQTVEGLCALETEEAIGTALAIFVAEITNTNDQDWLNCCRLLYQKSVKVRGGYNLINELIKFTHAEATSSQHLSNNSHIQWSFHTANNLVSSCANYKNDIEDHLSIKGYLCETAISLLHHLANKGLIGNYNLQVIQIFEKINPHLPFLQKTAKGARLPINCFTTFCLLNMKGKIEDPLVNKRRATLIAKDTIALLVTSGNKSKKNLKTDLEILIKNTSIFLNEEVILTALFKRLSDD